MNKTPVLDYEPGAPKEPVLLGTPSSKRWSFSFRYWKQLEFFGLSTSPPKWFVSLLERLKELSNKQIESFKSDVSEQNAWRYHAVDWNKKNIPIKRKDLDWVDPAYRDNEEDYPLLQFQVSQALGRIVGFWDESNVFNIVLLDPLHNIQPTKSTGYRVDACAPLSCEYTALLGEVNAIKKLNLCGDKCGYKVKLDQIPSATFSSNVVMHYIDDSQKAKLDSALDGTDNYTDLMMLGVDFLKG